jgi:uncharacterized protein (TIGR02588 family)
MGERRSNKVAHVPPWEWAIGIVGFVLVAATIAFLAYQAISRDDAPPDIAIRVEAVTPVQGGYLVEISATNNGGLSAGNVQVQGELRSASATVETTEMTFQYLPARSERKGGLFFVQDPRRHKLVLSARGYEKP